MAIMDWFRAGSRYTPLPTEAPTEAPNGGRDEGPAIHTDQQHRNQRRRTRGAVKLTGAALILVIAGYSAVAFMRAGPQLCDTPEHGYQCGTAISHSWGQYSPYFSVPSEIDAAVPEGCEVTFAQILSRHGARAPTFKRAVEYINLLDKIHDDAIYYTPAFHFLKTYEYTLGAEQLTEMGQQQMVNSGLKFYRRYRSLARTSAPFIRAGDQERVVHSAQNFTQGFHSALLADRKSTVRPALPYPILAIPETPTTNNTLHHGLCTAFETDPYYTTLGARAQAAYLATFAGPITTRLNTNLPGANLTDADTVSLMDLCPFDTVALSPAGTTLSPFCQLFAAAEWQHYDYYQSLGKWYGYGPGNPLGPTQGVGFVNELLARLTDRPVRDGTCTNRTLNGDAGTFPLGRGLYADFSHDNDMVGVLGALGVYGGVGMLDNETRSEPEEVGGYATAWAVPFAGRVYVEKMRCRGEREGGRDGDGDGEGEGEERVRVLVNDRVMPLRGCGADERGMCALGRFVESMAFARGDGRWDWCFSG